MLARISLSRRHRTIGLSLLLAIFAAGWTPGNAAERNVSPVRGRSGSTPAVAARPRRGYHGDRDIVFSAQGYHFTGLYYQGAGKLARHGKQEDQTLEENGPFHLYRVNPNGTRLTLLTKNSRADNTQPHWSPDGRSLLFLRRTDGRKATVSVCRTDSNARHIQTLLVHPTSPDRYIGFDGVSWSPDGKSVAVIASSAKEGETPEASLILLDATTGRRLQKIYGVQSATWSSKGHYLALSYPNSNEIDVLNRATGMRTSIRPSGRRLRHLGFLPTAGQFLGDLPRRDEGDGGDSHSFLFTVGATSAAVTGRQISWNVINAYRDADTEGIGDRVSDAYAADWFSGEERRWFGLPALGAKAALAEAYHGRSDGGQRDVFRADLASGKVWLLHRGQLVAVSPDGKQCAVATDEWTGPYKRGGRRCGPLEVVDTNLPAGRKVKTGHTVTSRLTVFAGGDWR